MSAANTALIQSLYAAFLRGDTAPILGALTPEATWHVHGVATDHPGMGVFNGPAGAERFFATIAEVQEAKEFTPREYYAIDDKVFVLGHYAWTMRGSGKQVASDWVHIFTIKGGKVAAFDEFTDTARFAEAMRG
jgi:ketosteroid isomerase-like protein